MLPEGRLLENEQRFAMEEWLGRVQAAVIEQQEHLSSGELQEVVHLIDHGEPAEGLLALAWILYNKKAVTPARIRGHVMDLAGDLVEERLWPPGWPPEQTIR